jgi:HJR/Mrr/RecB family endonuclease
MKLDFSEIKNWKEFEDLAAAYFRSMPEIGANSVKEVFVQPSGEGSDGGRDILVIFRISDSIITYERKWVVQCKFYNKAVSKSELSKINIPSLIHEYGAEGYLLICKNGVTSKVSEMFENLRNNCRFHYDYLIWDNNLFTEKIIDNKKILKRYFPKYYKLENY